MNLYQDTTGTLLMRLKQRGERDIVKMSYIIEQFRNKQNKAGILGFDYFTDQGSDAIANIAKQYGESAQSCIIWSINHYLGLNRHPYVIEKAIAALLKFGTGCGTSAISGGMNILHKQIEKKLIEWLKVESIILFPTGFSANIGLLSAICQENDQVLIDQESHASIRDGIRLSAAKKWISCKHNDLNDLEEKLRIATKQHEGKVIVVVESVYSTSGDICPLKELVALKKTYPFFLVVDEAHSFGLYGNHGQGLCFQEGIVNDVDFLTSTFSKATASIGGFVATKTQFTSYLQWSANTFAFQACFSPADAAAILGSMEIMEREPDIIRQLHAKNQLMRAQLVDKGFDLKSSQSPIIPIYINDTKKLILTCSELYQHGIFSIPICYPMVKANHGRIRFILNVRHTQSQIEKTTTVLGKLATKLNLLQ